MSFIYDKEIIDGIRSSRKLFGIRLYERIDDKGITIRTYLCGVFRTVCSYDYKNYYLFGFRVKQNQLSMKLNREQVQQILYLEKVSEEKKKEIQELNKEINRLNKLVKMSNNKTKSLKPIIQSQKLHKIVFGSMKNYMRGRSVIIIGDNAIENIDYQDEYIIVRAISNSFDIDKNYDYVFCQGKSIGTCELEEINNNNIECQFFFGRVFEDESKKNVPREVVYALEAKEYYTYPLECDDIALDISNEPLVGVDSIFAALQFVLYCHPSKIFMNGCDYNIDDERYRLLWNKMKIFLDEQYPDIYLDTKNSIGLKELFDI